MGLLRRDGRRPVKLTFARRRRTQYYMSTYIMYYVSTVLLVYIYIYIYIYIILCVKLPCYMYTYIMYYVSPVLLVYIYIYIHYIVCQADVLPQAGRPESKQQKQLDTTE